MGTAVKFEVQLTEVGSGCVRTWKVMGMVAPGTEPRYGGLPEDFDLGEPPEADWSWLECTETGEVIENHGSFLTGKQYDEFCVRFEGSPSDLLYERAVATARPVWEAEGRAEVAELLKFERGE